MPLAFTQEDFLVNLYFRLAHWPFSPEYYFQKNWKYLSEEKRRDGNVITQKTKLIRFVLLSFSLFFCVHPKVGEGNVFSRDDTFPVISKH